MTENNIRILARFTELTDLKIQKDEINKNALQRTKDSRIEKVREVIGEGMKPLKEFDDGLFEAIVQKVIIKSKNELEFWFENGDKKIHDINI